MLDKKTTPSDESQTTDVDRELAEERHPVTDVESLADLLAEVRLAERGRAMSREQRAASVTPAMISAGRSALEEVLERHGLEGILVLGCFSNAVAATYLAMEFARAKT